MIVSARRGRSIEVLQGDCGSRSIALFAEDGEAPELACEGYCHVMCELATLGG